MDGVVTKEPLDSSHGLLVGEGHIALEMAGAGGGGYLKPIHCILDASGISEASGEASDVFIGIIVHREDE